MGHASWPTRLAVPSDLHAYVIVSLSFYDFAEQWQEVDPLWS